MVTLWGITGMGKTWLAIKLIQQLQEHFEVVIWRSLYPPISFQDLLTNLITTLFPQYDRLLPNTSYGKTTALLHQLKRYRCLLVLDHADFVLQHCKTEHPNCKNCIWLPYKQDAPAYCELFKRIGETAHQSCVILTSREAPKDLCPLAGRTRSVRTFQVNGLPAADIQTLFNTDKMLEGTSDNWNALIQAYAGNPRALTLVAATIQSLFSGKIAAFLQQETPVFGEVSTLLKQQLRCLSKPAEIVLNALARYSTPVSFTDLRSHLTEFLSPQILLEALEMLNRRSLIETKADQFSLHPLVTKYLHSQLIGKKMQLIQKYPNNSKVFWQRKASIERNRK